MHSFPNGCSYMPVNDVVVGGCSSMPTHVLVCHIQPPQPFLVQGILVDSQGYQITRQVITLRLHQGAMQTEDIVKGLD